MAGLVATALQPNEVQNDVKAAPKPVPVVSSPTVKSMTGDQARSAIDSSKSYYESLPKAVEATAQGYSPTEWDVGKEQTVQGQIGGITRSESPLMQQAKTAGLQQAARRGLINSSLGISAAEESLYKAALPIASQDASTFATAAQSNQAARNRALEFGAASQNTAGLTNAQAQNAIISQGVGIQGQKDLQQMQGDIQKEIAQLNANTSLTQTDRQIASNQLIANIQSNTQLSVTDKQTMSAQAIASMNADLQTKLQMIQSNTQLSVADKQAISNQVIAANDIKSREKIAELNSDTQKAVSKLSSDTQLAIANLDAGTKEKLQNIVSQNSQLLQASTSASNFMSQYMQAVANVQTSPNMDEGAKQKAVDNLLNIMNSGLKAVGNIANLDLSQYFQPVPTNTEESANKPNNSKFSEFDYLNVP